MTEEATTTAEVTTPVSAASEPKLIASAATKDRVISSIVAKLAPKEEAPVVVPVVEEVKKEEVVVTPPEGEEEKVSSKVAKLREREAKIEAANKAAEERLKLAEEREASIKRMKEDPLKALEAAGVSFQEVAEAILKTGDPASPEKVVNKELEAIKAEIAAIKKEKEIAEQSAQEAKAQAEVTRINAAVSDYQTRIAATVASSGDKFELVAAYEAQDLVFDIATEYFTRHEKILSPEEAADMAEKFLEKRLEKVIGTKKLKSRFQPATKQQEPKTLTNEAQSFSAPVQAKTALLDREARLQEAIKRLRYT